MNLINTKINRFLMGIQRSVATNQKLLYADIGPNTYNKHQPSMMALVKDDDKVVYSLLKSSPVKPESLQESCPGI